MKASLRWSRYGNCWRVCIPNRPEQYFFEWRLACNFLLYMLRQQHE